MSALLDSLAAGFDGDATRRAALDAALRDGLPQARSEAWKYTPLRTLERRVFALPAVDPVAFDTTLLDRIPAPRMVFVNGRHAPEHSDLAGLAEGMSLRPLAQALAEAEPGAVEALAYTFNRADEVFARLNAALAADGAMLVVDAGVQAEVPLHLVFLGADGGSDTAWHLRNVFDIGAGASIRLVEHHLGDGAHAHLANLLAQVRLGDSARLAHVRLQDESPRATLFARTELALGRAARCERVDVELGAALSRHELNVRLDGEGASLSANGVLLGTDKRHLDTRLGVEHVARDTRSSLTWRGLAAGRSRAVFHGGILIHAGADGSDANLSNKNLLLDAAAEIDSQPVLEIHADEVRAAHGTTVGQLDPTAMFYLRSRGLPEGDARRLLTAAFCREVVTGIEDEYVRDATIAALDRTLATLENA